MNYRCISGNCFIWYAILYLDDEQRDTVSKSEEKSESCQWSAYLSSRRIRRTQGAKPAF